MIFRRVAAALLLIVALPMIPAAQTGTSGWPENALVKIYAPGHEDYVGRQQVSLTQRDGSFTIGLRNGLSESTIKHRGELLDAAVIDGADGGQAMVVDLRADGVERVLLIGSAGLIEHLEALARERKVAAQIAVDPLTRIATFEVELSGWIGLRSKE
ncbi:MAG: hypothetical protein P9M14_00325 [Candidatus Alcyoniella australis]|nr:hypothetical protein [Candidatus Alcyoniella australis]